MSSTASRPAPEASAALRSVSAGLYFVIALVPVAGLMVRASTSAGSGVPWGEVFVLFGGTIAAAVAARGIAFAPSLAGTVRAAVTAHGAAAIATVAVCAVLLARFPAPRPMIDLEAPDPLGPTIYSRAVEPFFLAQMALGLAAALAFRALGPVIAHRRGEPPTAIPGVRSNAALSIACYLGVIACAYGAFFRYPWPAVSPHALPEARLTFVFRVIPALIGSLAIAASASRIARAPLHAAVRLAALVQLVASAAAALLTRLAWMAFKASFAGAALYGARVAEPAPGPGVLLHAMAGLTASLFFWVLTPGAADEQTSSPVDRTAARLSPTSSANPVLVTCAGALLYFTIALVPVLGLIARGWHSRSADNWQPIPGADLLVLAFGTLAMAAAAVPVARELSLARALDAAGLAHFAGALVTAVLSVVVIVPRLSSWQFQPRGRAHEVILERVGSVAPYVGVQLGLGLAIAVVLRWWTRGSRLRRGSELSNPPPSPETPNEVVLAALSVACFLAIEAVPVLKLVVRLTIAATSPSRFDAMRASLATFSIPVVLGILVAASSAGTLARCRPGAAAALGAFLHFGAVLFVAPLGAPGHIARQLADGRSIGDAILMGSFWFVGPYFAGIFNLVIPLVVIQTVIGGASALVFCVLARWWARAAG